MSRKASTRAAASLAVLTLTLTWLVGCDSSQRRGQPPPTAESATDTGAPATPSEMPDDEMAPEPAPADAAVTPPARQPPKLPDYLEVVQCFRDSEPIRVNVQITPPDRLVIETANVRRLRIERHRLPLATDRSVVLRLDGQGIEWTADSTTYEFERSVNGVWTPVKRQDP